MTVQKTLTTRAILTFFSNTLAQLATLLVTFFLTPFLVRNLGAEMYGAWIILNNVLGYIVAADFRAAATLRFRLGTTQHLEDAHYKRQQIGAAIIVWLLLIPVFMLIGSIVTFFAPEITKVSPTHASTIQFVMFLLLLWIVLDRLFTLPANILRAVNLDYKAMGLNAVIIVVGGILSAIAISLGWGLIGLGISLIVGSFLSGVLRLIIAKREITWLGIAWPPKDDLKSFLSFSGWLLFSSLGYVLLVSNQFVIIGTYLGSVSTAIYSMTGAPIRILGTAVKQLLDAGDAGLAGISGQKSWEKLETIRTEIHKLSLALISVIGTGTIALSESFLKLWVGEGFYGGVLLTTLIVFQFTLQMISRVDLFLGSTMDQVRAVSVSTTITGLFALVLSVILLPSLGLVGVALTVAISYMALTIFLWKLIASVTGYPLLLKMRSLIRMVSMSLLLYAGAIVISTMLSPDGWIAFLLQASIIAIISSLVTWYASFSKHDRDVLKSRFAPHLQPFFSVLQSFTKVGTK